MITSDQKELSALCGGESSFWSEVIMDTVPVAALLEESLVPG